MEWFSWAVALILLISSVVSPWIVNRENNKHQLSLKKLDMYEQEKRKFLEDFIKSATNLHLNNTIGAIDKFNYSVNCLYIYFKDIPQNITTLQENYNNPNFFNELTNIVQALSEQIAKE